MEDSTNLLTLLLNACGPGSDENKVRAICQTEQVKHCDEMWTDNAGAGFSARQLPGTTAIAVKGGPIAEEYQTCFGSEPILVAGDEKGHYTRSVTDALIAARGVVGAPAQVALLINFTSDPSAILATDANGPAGCIAIPTENTHGFEVMLPRAINARTKALVAYLLPRGQRS